KAIGVAGIALTGLAVVPGFPTIIFLAAAAACFGMYRFLVKTPNASKMFAPAEKAKPKPAEKAAPTGPEAVLPFLAVDQVEIEIGYSLTKLADPRVGGDLSDRIT